ncbi:hypothetical protein SAMN05444161_2206 [Rhizobiales bacterium GAS191]|nr:hypothetical protein SAMN05444161_2206 [Rhizobiales bacterium GAS191]
MSTLITTAEASPSAEGRHAFDFFVGRWKVAHHRLRERLVGDTSWEDFAGFCETSHIIGGLGNVDDNVLELPAGTYCAATLRLFNPATGLWSIRWIDARDCTLGAPVHGRFEKGVGTFFGDDTLAGRPIRIRFVWSQITERSARWEQAFSADGGAS